MSLRFVAPLISVAFFAFGCGGSNVNTNDLTGSITFSAASTSPAYGGSTVAFTNPATNSSSGNLYTADNITRRLSVQFPAGKLYSNMVFPVGASGAGVSYLDSTANLTFGGLSGRITLSSVNGYALTSVLVETGGRTVTLGGGFSGFVNGFSAPTGVKGTIEVPTKFDVSQSSGPVLVGSNNVYTFSGLTTYPQVTIEIPASFAIPTSGNVSSVPSGTAKVSYFTDASTVVSSSSGYLSVYNSGSTLTFSILNFSPVAFNGVLFR